MTSVKKFYLLLVIMLLLNTESVEIRADMTKTKTQATTWTRTKTLGFSASVAEVPKMSDALLTAWCSFNSCELVCQTASKSYAAVTTAEGTGPTSTEVLPSPGMSCWTSFYGEASV